MSPSPSRGHTVSSLAALALLLLGACSSGPPRQPAPQTRPAEVDRGPRVGDDRLIRVTDLSEADQQAFRSAWRLFVTHDPRWIDAREEWLARGGAAPYLLSENLFRYFWSASRVNRRDEVARVGENARVVGEPAVAYFVKALVTDRWPLREPVTVEVFNPDNVNLPLVKTFTHYDMDDTTRQHAAHVLAMIGEPAVSTLASPVVQQSELPSARRYGLYALGAIGSDAAVEVLGRMVRTQATWQDRGAAAKALGFALHRNPAARAHLEAALEDPDEFVRRKAQEGLDGRTKIEF